MKKEIEGWLDRKIHKFAMQENRNSWVSKEQWLEIHEIFFAFFPSELYEWIVKLADSQGRCRLNKPIVWTPELVRRLKALEYKIAHVVDHWLVENSTRWWSLVERSRLHKVGPQAIFGTKSIFRLCLFLDIWIMVYELQDAICGWLVMLVKIYGLLFLDIWAESIFRLPG